MIPGIHTIYVQDKNNCGISLVEVSVIGYPKFFTPNNDGQNDTWNVLGVSENFYQSATVYIFDRFGKLLTEIDLYSDGWNGLLNGQLLPSTDYWFSVELVDLKGNVRVKKGHFSLIRR
ncbi:MAG: T9SS type B sorting domain-containing protein [Lutibacter sp.]